MKILISYFYQIRNFPKNYIPLSTAMWDPKWYHNNQGQDYQFFDKRGVLNGLRAEVFSPAEVYCPDGGCYKGCRLNPDNCDFQLNYLEYLNTLSYSEIINRFFKLQLKIEQKTSIKNPVFVLIVYETPDNKCSERGSLMQWFKQNGYELKEFSKAGL